MENPALIIRPGTINDFEQCRALDHRYETSRVWQLDVTPGDTMQTLRFQTVRLPRPITVAYPYPAPQLADRWCQATVFLVAEEDGIILAYMTLLQDMLDPILWLMDLVVTSKHRRQGLGSNLLAAGSHWAREHRLKRLMAKVQTKNDPAISFFRKNGFSFCGYNEYQYHNESIALYFTSKL